MDERRGGGREATWPRGHPATTISRRNGSWAPFFTPRHKADLFAWPSATRADRGKDRRMAKEALDPRQSPFHLSACLGDAAFEVQLAAVVGHRLGDREPQQGDPGGWSGDHRSLQPPLELPSHPVHHGSRSERPIPPPPALQ
jgi:hypothetical protein